MEISRLKPLYTREDIRKRVEQLGEQISKKYGDEPLVVVCVLKGAFIFFDCVDSGHTMQFLMEQFRARNPRSLELAALVDKKARRVVDVHVDYPGFVMDDGFIVGYGLDYAEKLRTLPDICIPDEN